MFLAGVPFDPTRETRRLAVLIPIYIVLEVASTVHCGVSDWFILQLMDGAPTGTEIDDTVGLIAVTGGTLTILLLLVLGACIAVSGMWIYRVSANAAALCPSEDRITPGWSVGWFFVPIANLWMSLRVLTQIFHAAQRPPRLDGPQPRIVTTWLGCVFGGAFLAQASSRISMRVETTVEVAIVSAIKVVASGLLIAGAVFWLRIVKQITERQAVASLPDTGTKGD